MTVQLLSQGGKTLSAATVAAEGSPLEIARDLLDAALAEAPERPASVVLMDRGEVLWRLDPVDVIRRTWDGPACLLGRELEAWEAW